MSSVFLNDTTASAVSQSCETIRTPDDQDLIASDNQDYWTILRQMEQWASNHRSDDGLEDFTHTSFDTESSGVAPLDAFHESVYGHTFGLHDGKSVISLDPGSGHCSELSDQTTLWDPPRSMIPQYVDSAPTGTVASPPGTHMFSEAELSFCEETIEGRKVFICTYRGCNKEFSRFAGWNRHCNSVHRKSVKYKCSIQGCKRALVGFPRRDNRNKHERTPHRQQ